VKLFLDTSTLISGLLFEGNERLLLDLGRLGVCKLVTNEYVREEVRDVLNRPHLGLAPQEQDSVLDLLARHVRVLESPPIEAIKAAKGRLADEGDLPILSGFEASGCDFLVTGDKQLRRQVPEAISSREALRRVLGGVSDRTHQRGS